MEVLTVPYVWPYFVGIFPYIGPKKGLIYGRYLQFRFLKWPLIYVDLYNGCYPGLVNIQKIMENDHVFIGKSTISMGHVQ